MATIISYVKNNMQNPTWVWWNPAVPNLVAGLEFEYDYFDPVLGYTAVIGELLTGTGLLTGGTINQILSFNAAGSFLYEITGLSLLATDYANYNTNTTGFMEFILAGNDTINGSNFGDTLYGGAGNDTITGDNLGDVIDGGTGKDALYGRNGNDTFIAGGFGFGSFVAAEYIDGGFGNDTLILSGALANYNYTKLDTGTLINGSGEIILLNSVENVFFTTGAQTVAVADLTNDAPTFFNGTGKQTTAIGTGNDQGRSVTVQADGKILVAGTSFNGVNEDFALARYNVDGSLDTSFDTDGKVITDFAGFVDLVQSVTVQADGKILVAGSSNNDFALARYNVDGSLDTSFGVGGKLTTDFGASTDEGFSVTVYTDGKILVAGSSNNDFALARYNTDGSLDTTFNTDGKVITDLISLGTITSPTDIGSSVTVQADGRILMAGSSRRTLNTDFDFALVR
jgi:uncharacterized delta-60 repeat protein